MTLTINDKRVFTTGPVKLHGFQAVMKPSKYGYSLSALLPEEEVYLLEDDREEALKWATSKLKNPKRSVMKPEPWVECNDEPSYVKIKFSWNEDTQPVVYDTNNNKIDDENLPLYSGAVVRLVFKQKPYILKDDVTYGTSLKLSGVQVVSLNGAGGGLDTSELTDEDVLNCFNNAMASLDKEVSDGRKFATTSADF